MASDCNHPNCFDLEKCRRPPKTPKARQPLRREPIRRSLPKKKANADELTAFFDSIISVSEPTCYNCGAFASHLFDPNYKFHFKSCVAHLLPKRFFKSIATNPLNVMILGSGYSGMCNCHDNYDASWSKASIMKIWPEVVERFKTLYPLIAPNEHKFIPEVLLKELQTLQ